MAAQVSPGPFLRPLGEDLKNLLTFSPAFYEAYDTQTVLIKIVASCLAFFAIYFFLYAFIAPRY